MSIAASTAAFAAPQQEVEDIYYTRCPAPTATGVATGLDRLRPAFSGTPFRFTALQDVTDPELRRRHFDHRIVNLIREGGNIPAIWARSEGAPTRLLGITWLDEVQAIVVPADSEALAIADLPGLRIAVPRGTTHGVDVSRISALRGFAQGLATIGAGLDDVTEVAITPEPGPAWTEQFEAELAALADGRADAAWIKGAAGAAALAEGRVRPILRIDQLADPIRRVNNGTPRTLTVRQELIDQRPELVERYVATINGAVSALADDRHQLWQVLAGETHQRPDAAEAAYANFSRDSLLPSLTPHRIAGLQDQADFLYRQGFIARPVDVAAWAYRPA